MKICENTAGVDEAGRGCLAGDVVAAAVILDPARPIDGLQDSKKLTLKQRLHLFQCIQESALAWAIGIGSIQEIHQLNILQASLLAMTRAVCHLTILPKIALIDGNQMPGSLPCQAQTIIDGANQVASIAAASIIAKVWRDHIMIALSKRYPHYGFERHKGYGTRLHQQALEEHGITPYHRLGFSPVKIILAA